MKAEPRLLLLAMFYSLYVATPANATCADKIDGHANAVVNIPGNYEIQKIDGNSTAQISAAHVHLCQKIDGNSDAIITSRSNIRIDQKIDGHSLAQLIADSGSVSIGSGHGGDKIDGASDVLIVSGGSVVIKGKIDGRSQVRIRAGGPIIISGKIDGASEVRWCGPSEPAVGGGIDGNAKVIKEGEFPCPSDHLWDLVQSNFGLDPNGFLRMPNWKWASPGPPQVAALRDVCDDCPCRRGTWGVDAPDDQERNWLAFPSCTHGPIHENSNNLCSGNVAETWPPWHPGSGSGMGYHMNWGPVEYEGPLHWADRSTWAVASEHENSGDNEYTFNILRPELFLVARNWDSKGVHLEFDAGETVDEWDGTGTWWETFHKFVDTAGNNDNDAIQKFLNNPFAITIGMLGLDVAHKTHHAELHPVYAMFILDPPGLPAPPDGEVRWSFFVRNWGNEGACGRDQEQLVVDHIDVQLPSLGLGSLINVRPYREGGDQSKCPQEWFNDPNGVLRFPMASPEMKCGWVGELTMKKKPFDKGPIINVAVEPFEEEQLVVVDPAIINRLNPNDRQQLFEQISTLSKVPRTKPNGQCWLKHSVPTASPHPRCVSGVKEVEYDTDRFGSDYRNFDPPQADPALCQISCNGDAQCKAWTYVRPGIRHPNGQCWLKHSVPTASPHPRCVSGVKEVEYDTDRFGSDYNNFDPPQSDPALCQISCNADAQCKAWTYVRPGIRHPAFGEKVAVKQLSSPLPRSGAFRVTGTNVKAASDPPQQQLEERRRQLIEEFVKAHGSSVQ